MANLESNTLLEKLTQINNVKNRIRQVIIDIGGKDYVNEETPFAAFPHAISQVHSDIVNVSKMLSYIDNGGDLAEIATDDISNYADTAPYLEDILLGKQTLVDNLRLLGIDADISESLNDLVNKILLLNEEGS